jgi:sec-independent protein translocase protein TatB
MFDIGFGELLLIAVVALVVLGPEKLPKAARTLGTLLRRMRDGWDSVRAEVEREIEAEEMKRKLKEAQDYMRQAGQDVRQAGQDVGDRVRESVDSVRRAGEQAADDGSGETSGESAGKDPDEDIFDRDLFEEHATPDEPAGHRPDSPDDVKSGKDSSGSARGKTGNASGSQADEH